MFVIERVVTNNNLVAVFGEVLGDFARIEGVGLLHRVGEQHARVIKGGGIGQGVALEGGSVLLHKCPASIGFFEHPTALRAQHHVVRRVTTEPCRFARTDAVATEQFGLHPQRTTLTQHRAGL